MPYCICRLMNMPTQAVRAICVMFLIQLYKLVSENRFILHLCCTPGMVLVVLGHVVDFCAVLYSYS